MDDRQAEQIVHNVINHLQGEYGIKRYLGDSFYCTNYESNLREGDLTRDFSDDMAFRDAFFVAGGEAQWCLFDPILSIYYGLRFRRTHDALEFLKQTEDLNRFTPLARARMPNSDSANWIWGLTALSIVLTALLGAEFHSSIMLRHFELRQEEMTVRSLRRPLE